MKRWTVALIVVASIGCALITWASTPVGVTPTVLLRTTFADEFKVKSEALSPVDFEAKSKLPMDIVTRQHDYVAGGSTGWHTHPGPIFVQVVEGELTFYEYNDQTCTPKVVKAGYGYVDSGHGHLARNETDRPARDISIIIAPPLPAGFRGELPAPSPYCGF